MPDTVLEGIGQRYQSGDFSERRLVLLTVRMTTLLPAVLKHPSYLLGRSPGSMKNATTLLLFFTLQVSSLHLPIFN